MVSHHLRSLVTLVIMVVPTRFSPFVEHEGEEPLFRTTIVHSTWDGSTQRVSNITVEAGGDFFSDRELALEWSRIAELITPPLSREQSQAALDIIRPYSQRAETSGDRPPSEPRVSLRTRLIDLLTASQRQVLDSLSFRMRCRQNGALTTVEQLSDSHESNWSRPERDRFLEAVQDQRELLDKELEELETNAMESILARVSPVAREVIREVTATRIVSDVRDPGLQSILISNALEMSNRDRSRQEIILLSAGQRVWLPGMAPPRIAPAAGTPSAVGALVVNSLMEPLGLSSSQMKDFLEASARDDGSAARAKSEIDLLRSEVEAGRIGERRAAELVHQMAEDQLLRQWDVFRSHLLPSQSLVLDELVSRLNRQRLGTVCWLALPATHRQLGIKEADAEILVEIAQDHKNSLEKRSGELEREVLLTLSRSAPSPRHRELLRISSGIDLGIGTPLLILFVPDDLKP